MLRRKDDKCSCAQQRMIAPRYYASTLRGFAAAAYFAMSYITFLMLPEFFCHAAAFLHILMATLLSLPRCCHCLSQASTPADASRLPSLSLASMPFEVLPSFRRWLPSFRVVMIRCFRHADIFAAPFR